MKTLKLILLILICLALNKSYSQTYRPYVIGYLAGQNKPLNNNTGAVTISGGALVPQNYVLKAIGEGNANVNYLQGFRPNILMLDPAFNDVIGLKVSKGYFADYIELKWNVINYESDISRIKVYRKVYGSSNDSVEVASLAKDVTLWKDDYAESGVYYEYYLHAEGIFPNWNEYLNFVHGVGFRIPVGQVVGQVTFDGGSPAAGVKIVAGTETQFERTSVQLNANQNSYLKIEPQSQKDRFKLDKAFTFQAWFLPESSTGALFSKGNQYLLSYSIVGQNYNLNLTVDGNLKVSLMFPIKVDTFFHVSMVKTLDHTYKLFVNYNKVFNYEATSNPDASGTPNNDFIYLGKNETSNNLFYGGYIDEVRLWYKALSKTQVANYYDKFIGGKEDSLLAYYRLDEFFGSDFYDGSSKGFTFNEHHGEYGSTVSLAKTKVPKELGIKGLTDITGNYLIAGIPYTADGTIYKITPSLGSHTFTPNAKNEYIGPGDVVKTNVNFVDDASIKISGSVYYKDTDFPVAGVNVFVDEQIALAGNGSPIMTDAEGVFSLNIPIGFHQITLSKYGHHFSKTLGRFPKDSTASFNFQQDVVVPYRMVDATLVKVVGRLVGGPVQGGKNAVFGQSTNYIGSDGKVILATVKNKALVADGVTPISQRENLFFKDGNGEKTTGTTQYTYQNNNKEIVVRPDNVTGEFVAYLLPEQYTVLEAKAGNVNGIYKNIVNPNQYDNLLDLTNKSTLKTDQIEDVDKIDSIQFQHKLNLIHRVTPTIEVRKNKNEYVFWSKELLVGEGKIKIDLYNDDADIMYTEYPIFEQHKKYAMEAVVFESYDNGLSGGDLVTDNVAVTDGKITFNNNFALYDNIKTVDLNDKGIAKHEWVCGLPETKNGFIKSLTVVSETGKNGVIKTLWDYNGHKSASNIKGLVGIGVGIITSGSNFVTKGPAAVDMILRDPHGSTSYAWYEVGNSYSKTSTTESNLSSLTEGSATISLGGDVTTWVGIGAGLIIETETTFDASVGLAVESSFTGSMTQTEEITNTKRWQTSAEPNYVGGMGDVFIGRSKNFAYGIAESVNFQRQGNESCVGCLIGMEGEAVQGYFKLDLGKQLSISPEFGTGFQYTSNHIKNYLIPSWVSLRNIFIDNQSKAVNSWYEFSENAKAGGSDFGKTQEFDQNSITSATVGANINVLMTGERYNIRLKVGDNWPRVDSQFVDTIKYYNDQIVLWENRLAENEKHKVNGVIAKENLSFDAGVVYTSEIAITSTESNTETYSLMIAPSVAAELGFEVLGIGMSASISETVSHTSVDENGTEQVSTKTFGYELSDPDQGDYFSLDIKSPADGFSPIFALRGGQSSCPHEGGETTEYYTDEGVKILSELTVQREKPGITCLESSKYDVPEDKPAFFDCNLANYAEGESAWFMLSVDDESNQTGAIIKVDGTAIENGRMVFVPAGNGLNKVITIEKNQDDVFNYENIGIILHSICQFDPADNWADIADTILLTAKFKPVCTAVEIKSPSNYWTAVKNDIVNDKILIPIVIDEFNPNHFGLNKIVFEISPAFSSNWVTVQTFHADDNAFNLATNNGTQNLKLHKKIEGASEVNFDLDLFGFNDREYNLRARSVCPADVENVSEISTGIKDTKLPELFGTPQPGDGILSIGEDVQIKFNERLVTGALVKNTNFTVRGVKNGGSTSHNAAIYFDGTGSFATVNSPVNVNDKSFSFQFWIKRGDLNKGTILKQGEIEIAFNAASQIEVKLGDETHTSVSTFAFTNDWINLTVAYDHPNKKLNSYGFFGASPVENVFNSVDVTKEFLSDGILIFGNGSQGFLNAFLHDVRLWEKHVDEATAAEKKSLILNGDEMKLASLWLFEDLSGIVAVDKARSHHAILNGGEWRIFPTGFSKKFDGSGVLNINTSSTVVIDNEMDFTIEMWFKGDENQKGKVLFSNGRIDGTDPIKKSWEIGFDTQSGVMYSKNNGVIIGGGNGNSFLDNKWHHLAFVLKRKGNATIYVDGNSQAFENSAPFGELSGSFMTLGASRTRTNGTPYQKKFTGRIDEFRIWNTSKTKKLLELNMYSKLQGVEIGLAAYYPFDEYVDGVLVSTLKDKVVDGKEMRLAIDEGTTGFDNADAANVKDARPVEDLQFDYVANTDEIIINITEDGAQIEKTIVEFSVQKVEDQVGNQLASPITWSAYIKQNPVLWDRKFINFEKFVYDPLSFEVEILNLGGTDQNYIISNLPSWLTTDETSGSLEPASRLTIQLAVNEGLSIGTHEVALYLSGDFGFNEVLIINIKVVGDEPDWTIDPSKFANSMSIVGQIQVGTIVSTDRDDKLIALVNGEVRGIANLMYMSHYDQFMMFMDIYSDSGAGEEIVFQVWDASEGQVQTDVFVITDTSNTGTLKFKKDLLLGKPSAPILFNTVNNILLPLVINSGYNWLSFPLNSTSNGDMTKLFKNVAVEGMLIRTRNGSDVNQSVKIDQFTNGIWEKAGEFGVNNGWMYMLTSPVDDTIPYIGQVLDPKNVNLEIKKGEWLWIGSPLLSNIPLNDAFSNFQLVEGDFIKGQSGFAVYDPNGGWMGSLAFIKPTAGYMFKSAAVIDRNLVFPDYKIKSGSNLSDELVMLYEKYNLNYVQFSGNASLIASVDVCENRYDEFKIASYAGDELRGVSPIKDGKFFVSLYGNDKNDQLRFELIDSYDRHYELNERLNYLKNGRIGTVREPFNFTSKLALIDPVFENSIVVSPTIYGNKLQVNYSLTTDCHVSMKLYDVTGKLLVTILDNDEVKGNHDLSWFTSFSNKVLPAGMHMLRVTIGDDFHTVVKLIKTY
jgi:hypothetical protein